MLHTRATVIAFGLAVGLFVVILIFLEIGRRVGVRRATKLGDAARVGVGKAEAPVYALLGLLIGFTFSGAGSRFDSRRELVIKQVNAIHTAWERIDALPAAAQPEVRANLQSYVDALIAMYQGAPSVAEGLREPAEVSRARSALWTRAVSACLAPDGEKARMLLLPSLGDMFDVAETERLARRIHPPAVIYVMLGVSVLAGALFSGYGLANGPVRNWMFSVGIAATIAVAMYVIVELEFPRLGLVRVEASDQALTDVRATIR